MLYLQKMKSEAYELYCAYEAWLTTQFRIKVKWLCSDHGREYISEQFSMYLKSKGTERHVTIHDTSEHNGVAEQLNWTLVENVHAIMHTTDLPKGL